MDNSLSKSIIETIRETKPNTIASFTESSTSANSTENGILSYLFSISYTTWIIIIIILAFLGFNIFIYLAKGTQDITNFFNPIVSKIASVFAMTTGQVVNTTATGAKSVVDTTANVLDTGLTGVQNVTDGKKASSSVGGTPLSKAIPQADIMQNNTLNKVLNQSNVEKNIGRTHEYVADDATSNIQKTNSKGGYCYIGEERGHRSCMRVNDSDTCMSGEIFPTRDICINPSLRV
jgi:hypothetical protein